MTPTYEVCLTPALLPHFTLKEKVIVVVDIFRATSSIVAAFDAGVKHIRPAATVAEALSHKSQPNTFLAGERDGKPLIDFDFGNSPTVFLENARKLAGKALVITTTNGTKAIEAGKGGAKIVIGAFLNLAALAAHLKAQQHSVICLCAGWKNHINMEDTLFAGALGGLLDSHFHISGDAALLAKQLYAKNQEELFNLLKSASHYQRLAKFGVEDDLRYCITHIDVSQHIPKLEKGMLVVE